MIYEYDLEGKDTPTSYAAMDKQRTIAALFEKTILNTKVNY